MRLQATLPQAVRSSQASRPSANYDDARAAARCAQATMLIAEAARLAHRLAALTICSQAGLVRALRLRRAQAQPFCIIVLCKSIAEEAGQDWRCSANGVGALSLLLALRAREHPTAHAAVRRWQSGDGGPRCPPDRPRQ